MLFDQLSLDEKFEFRGFSLEQYRTLYHLCICSNVFKSFRNLSGSLDRANSLLANRLTYQIFKYNFDNSRFGSTHWEKEIVVSYVLNELISVGINLPDWENYSMGICMLVMFNIDYEFQNDSSGQKLEEWQTFFASLGLHPNQLRDLERL
jgi:hypothetical protein